MVERDDPGSVLSHCLSTSLKTCILRIRMILIEILLSLQNRKSIGEDVMGVHHPGSQLLQ